MSNRFTVRFIENPKTHWGKKHRVELKAWTGQKFGMTHEEACLIGEALLASARYWDGQRRKNDGRTIVDQLGSNSTDDE